MSISKKTILTLVGVYCVATGLATFGFTTFFPPTPSLLISPKTKPTDTEPQTSTVNTTSRFTGPRTEACPLNGAYFTKEEQALWSERRPLMVMIENHEDARPLSGIQSADIVYEAVAEGGITRLMAAFYCAAAGGMGDKKYDVGPVRSARTYFLDWASEYADFPLYNHVGGANCSPVSPGGPCTTDKRAQALEQIEKYGWLDGATRSDMNQFALSYKDCRREPERTGVLKATEHTVYCSTQSLWERATERGLSAVTKKTGNTWDDAFRSWQFKDDAQEAARGSVANIGFDFWPGYKQYAVTWTYDKTTNTYARKNGSLDFIDFNTQKIVSAKSIVIQFVKESGPVDDHKHMLYQTTGTGEALVFQDGTVEKAKWSKPKRTSRTVFTNTKGTELKFNRGLVWIEALPATAEVNYEP